MPMLPDKLLLAIGSLSGQMVDDADRHLELWRNGVADSAWWCRAHLLDQIELLKELVGQLPEPPEPP